MLRLYEDEAKAWLLSEAYFVPVGGVAGSPDEVVEIARRTSGGTVVVKGLLPFGRRGKSGVVKSAANPEEAGRVAQSMLGKSVSGVPVERVYVEEHIDIYQELYLAFILSSDRPQVVLSLHGGVDIETTSEEHPDYIVREDIDPIRGLSSWRARKIWSDAGVSGLILRELGEVTAQLYNTFRRGDALLLELNPLVIDTQSRVVLVGAMAGIDTNALHRHPQWAAIKPARAVTGASEREKQVAEIDAAFSGGECRYIELDGDIGLLVGGGGAGLYQHDLIIAAGERPANHCVTPPTGSDSRKILAVIRAIFDNPKTKCLLVGFNFAQMARADTRVAALVQVLDEKHIDTSRFPIVIRLFGAGEDEARAAVTGRKGIHYLPRGTSLEDAVKKIVEIKRLAHVEFPA